MIIALPDTTLLLQMLGLLLVIGAFAGVLAGLLGVGGGIILVPAFFYAFQTLGYAGPQLMHDLPCHLAGHHHRDLGALGAEPSPQGRRGLGGAARMGAGG